MTEIQKKIKLLQRIAHRLNEAHVQWALGASMLLYFKGITSAFHLSVILPVEALLPAVTTGAAHFAFAAFS